MDHLCSVFRHSCLKVPVDPLTKMPKTEYERKKKSVTAQGSIDSVSTACSVSTADINAEKLKDFYRSIPDYNDINHLPNEEFYSTLKNLREKRKIMFEIAVEHIDDNLDQNKGPSANNDTELVISIKNSKRQNKRNGLRKHSADNKDAGTDRQPSSSKDLNLLSSKIAGTSLLKPTRKITDEDVGKYVSDDDTKLKSDLRNIDVNKKDKDRPKRIQSACSISWNDTKVESKNEIDEKFDKFFDGKKYCSPIKVDIGEEFRTRSMPTSPFRMRRGGSPPRRRKSITIPKPFKMTERDEDERVVNELRTLRKSFSDDLLHHKFERERRQFRAHPVPIESRIPLYDKILEDQAMRRAITKINSEAELRAQMKPFSFTKREEKGLGGICDRATTVLPKTRKKKRFKARPVPKNLFSNYFYDKMKEDEFFRGVNRRIRAEELLRQSQFPGNMGTRDRDRSRQSTPAAHSDLPIDPSPSAPSVASLERHRCNSPTKNKKNRHKFKKEEFISTSPQPFRFSTADRAAKKMEDMVKKIYLESKSTTSIGDAGADNVNRAYSALDLRAAASGRSNLAALLRAEAVRRKFEMEALHRLEEQRRKAEMKHRDRLLRSKPAWHLVKNNHEEDIAMRLLTRRDEERLRREEFLHEMELMYGRVQQQPLLFERYYAPRSYTADSIQLSPRKTKRRNSKSNAHFCSPIRSRKVSINDTAETFNGAVAEYLNRIDNDDISVSEDVLDSERAKQ